MQKLLGHFVAMQARASAYIEPTPRYESLTGELSKPLADNGPMVGTEPAQRNWLFANDMVRLLDGPEQREAQAEAEFDYVAETDVTASNVWGGENSDATLLRHDLAVFIAAAERLDQHKKVLFRKRSNELAGLPQPGDWRTADFFPAADVELLHGIIGVATEAGELCEVALARLNDPNRAFDVTNVREEIGDVLWYLARLVKWAGTSFLAEMRRNIAKLRERHGASFNAERDANRDLGKERALLESEGVVIKPADEGETFDAEQIAAGVSSSPPSYAQTFEFPDEPHSGVDPV